MGKLSVYHLNESELSVGDQMRITRNDAQHDLVNGQLARVVAIETATVTIETGGRRHHPAHQSAAASGLCLHHHGAQRPGPDLRPGAV